MTRLQRTFSMLLALGLCGGCAKFDLKKNIPWEELPFNEPPQPMKLIPCWTDTVLQSPGRPAMRGFGGRLMFYGKKDNTPIKVEGSLVVYAFDEMNRDPNNVVPDRKFVFSVEQFKDHHSKSDRGHSYSVWIPWDEAGGDRREISLIARFTPNKGGTVVSEQTKHLLPGAAATMVENVQVNKRELTPAVQTGAVQRVSFDQPIEMPEAALGANGRPQRMQTTTIAIPSRFGRALPAADTAADANEEPGLLWQPNAEGASEPRQLPASGARQTPGQWTGPRLDRFALEKSRPLTGQAGRPAHGHGPWQQYRSMSQSAPRSTQQSVPAGPESSLLPAAGSTTN
jgi:hypothetical protein